MTRKKASVLLLPGLWNSGPDHWQSTIRPAKAPTMGSGATPWQSQAGPLKQFQHLAQSGNEGEGPVGAQAHAGQRPGDGAPTRAAPRLQRPLQPDRSGHIAPADSTEIMKPFLSLYL